MTVSNATIRELEEAASAAVQAMNDKADMLEREGHGAAAQSLRLAAVTLDLAGTECSRERLGSESELREEVEAERLGSNEIATALQTARELNHNIRVGQLMVVASGNEQETRRLFYMSDVDLAAALRSTGKIGR